jgi:hypothetical protein
MRLSSFAFAASVFVLGVVSIGSTKATIIGTVCKTDKDCNVKGQVCAAGFNGGPTICTHTCTGNTGAMGCPAGYDCFPTDPSKGSTCNKVLYEVTATGDPLLIGVDCSSSNDICTGTGSTNPAPECRRVSDMNMPPMPVDFDPTAYCTGSCNGDYDCPLDFYCGEDYDMVTKCLRRRLCSPCTVDANCGGDWPICVPTKDGMERYCSKSCNADGDCGGTSNTAYECDSTTNGAGQPVKACLHRAGACYGTGKICDPCRSDADCMLVPKSFCVINIGTSEGFCSIQCKTDAACSSQAGSVPAYCDNKHDYSSTDPNGMSNDICNGDDGTYVSPELQQAGPPYNVPEGGLLSCWLPKM